jgi:hypothetical protein
VTKPQFISLAMLAFAFACQPVHRDGPDGSPGGGSGGGSGGGASVGGGSGGGAGGAGGGSAMVPDDGGSGVGVGGGGGGGGGSTEPGGGEGGERCGYEDRGRKLVVAEGIEVCLPEVTCTSETCPPSLGTCVDGACVFQNGYQGLRTQPEAWATYYCTLANGSCHGVTQLEYPEVTAAKVSDELGLPTCDVATAGQRCVGIVASPPMMVGNSEEAIDPATGKKVRDFGLGMTEASGLCYEIVGPGGTAVVAVTDRCGGYCKCEGSGNQECGPCVNAPDMEPNCACVGAVPGLHGECCGRGCPEVKGDCDWCASNNHPHFDLDEAAYAHVCGDEAMYGSCQLEAARYVPCMAPDPRWPPQGGVSCGENAFACADGSPAPEQPEIPGSGCCCAWGKVPVSEDSCG